MKQDLREQAGDRLLIVCQYCRKPIGLKNGDGVSGESSGICPDCWGEHFHGIPFPGGLEEYLEALELIDYLLTEVG